MAGGGLGGSEGGPQVFARTSQALVDPSELDISLIACTDLRFESSGERRVDGIQSRNLSYLVSGSRGMQIA